MIPQQPITKTIKQHSNKTLTSTDIQTFAEMLAYWSPAQRV
jgi:hypothetical protein